jgi:hypothetical protein
LPPNNALPVVTPQIPLPTDNFHKFVCLLGLAMALSGLLGFYTLYTSTLDKKIALVEEINQLELTEARSPVEQKRLELKKGVLDVTKSNERTFTIAVTVIMGLGLGLIFVGGVDWHRNVQALDNRIKELELKKLELEVRRLEKEAVASAPESFAKQLSDSAPAEVREEG